MTHAGIVAPDQPAHPRKLTLELCPLIYRIVFFTYQRTGKLSGQTAGMRSLIRGNTVRILHMSLYLLNDVSYKTSKIYTVLWVVLY